MEIKKIKKVYEMTIEYKQRGFKYEERFVDSLYLYFNEEKALIVVDVDQMYGCATFLNIVTNEISYSNDSDTPKNKISVGVDVFPDVLQHIRENGTEDLASFILGE